MQTSTQERPITRMLAIVLAAFLAIGAACVLAGCSGTSDEQVIREGLAKELDAFKSPTKESLEPYIGEIDSDQMETLESYGIDIYEFIEHAFRGFDYTINDVTVDGDTATADVTISNIDVAKVASSVMDTVSSDKDIAAKVQKLAEGGDQSEVMKYVFSLMYDAMDAATETVSTDTTIKLTKTNNQWDIDEDSISDMIAGMYGGMMS
ncbi:MAG: hypothetical protein E7000_00435 [Coriobacteriaceae bacterium]|nr:hypothetical protein [Coriobacteriaceae bacterium]